MKLYFFGIVQIIFIIVNRVESSPLAHYLKRITKEMNVKLKSLKTISKTKYACRFEVNQVMFKYCNRHFKNQPKKKKPIQHLSSTKL